MPRSIVLVASLAAACALSAVTALSPPDAHAADGLIITSDARYEVRPEAGLVAVTIDAVATNVTPDSATEQFYFTAVTVPVQAGASGFAATSGGGAIPVSVVESTEDYVAVEVTFKAEVFFQQSYGFQLSFVMADDGGEAEHDTRIRESFVAFPVWAFGSPDASDASVEVAWPRGYAVTVPFGEMRLMPTESGPLLTAQRIVDPSAFAAYVTGEREGARTREEVAVPMADGDAVLLMLAWIDDPEWLRQQTDVLLVGLPALERAIGLDYPLIGTLSVSEHAYRHLGDYVGLFNPNAATIQMRFDADTFTTLHEAAHVWFNGALFEDRWILEGFASYYAEVVGNELELEIVPDELTAEITEAAFPLNAWLAPSLDEDDRETYAYAAAPAAAAQIAALAGADGLQGVWQAANANQLAYAASDDDPRTGDDARPASWQRLLDLLENATAADYDPIWREWIVTEAQAPLLDARESTRASYAETVAAADGWTLPRSMRALMDAWDFSAAEDELAEAHAIFDDRAALVTDARELELVPTDALRAAFEDGGLEAAANEVREQREALDALESATTELAPEPGLLEQVGLIGEVAPSRALTRARDQFEAGDDAAAVDAARAAMDERATADERGRARVAIVAGGLLALDLAAMGAFAVLRRRRAGEPAVAILPPPG